MTDQVISLKTLGIRIFLFVCLFQFIIHTHTFSSRGETHFLIWFLILCFQKMQPQRASIPSPAPSDLLKSRVKCKWGLLETGTPNFARELSRGHSYKFLIVQLHYMYNFFLNKNLGLRLQSIANQWYAGLWTQMAHLHGSWNIWAFTHSLGKADFICLNLCAVKTSQLFEKHSSLPCSRGGCLNPQTSTPGAREMPPPRWVKLHPGLTKVSNLKASFPISHLCCQQNVSSP